MTVITRFAPSPTGHLHIGGARTAVFSWLLARHFGGKFVLRIEDTDTERSTQEYTDSILASMGWLGLFWDGEPVYQSQRFELYREYVQKLLDSGNAYWCECTPEQVEAMREEARASGKKPKYDGRCRDKGLGPGAGRAVRLKVPESGLVGFDDMVKGRIEIDVDELDDMVLQRAGGQATYNMAVVVDDLEMGITHVLRGDDHVNNTPKQILIYNALGAALPVFGHVPMILGPDRQKLSKRHGAKAVIDYQQDGLLPEALVNYLVRLGWSHGDQEIFSLEELVKLFDGKNLSGSPAGFDPEKLLWVNAQHLRAASAETLLPMLMPYLEKLSLAQAPAATVLGAIPMLQPRVNTLVELAAQLVPLLARVSDGGNLHYEESATTKAFTAESKAHLVALRSAFAAVEAFDKEAVHTALHGYVEANGLKFKAVGPALRVALMGSLGGPDLSEVMALLGKPETLARLDAALALQVTA